jgi:LPS export ABC transporter protein LptC
MVLNPAMQRLIRIGFLVMFGILIASCAKDASDDMSIGGRGSPDEVFFDFTTQESDSGKTRWVLISPKASKFKDKGLMVLEKPTIKFFDDRGKLETTLTSESGELYQDTQDMLAYGNVVVTSQSGDVLETDSLFWDDAREKILSNSFVRLKRGSDILTGIGLECDYNLSSINVKKDVSATIIDKKGKSDE